MPNPFPLPISYGHTDAVKNSGGYLVNLEAEVAPKDARSPVTLRGSPGLSSDGWDECLDSGGVSQPVVACIEVDGAGYIITKSGLFRVFADGGNFQLATFSLQTRVRCETNGIDIVATDGLRIWAYTIRTDEQDLYDTSAAFVDYGVDLTAEPNWYPAKTITFIDGYLVLERTDSNQFYNTEAYSLTVIATAFSQAESSPDDVVAVIADHQILNVLGSKTTEFHFDSGVGDSPFQRVQGGVVEHGAASPHAVAKTNNNTFVLSPEFVVYAYQGYQPRPISTAAIEDELKLRDLTTATGYTYVDGGHFYYVLNVEGAGDVPDATFVYDLSTGLWHRRRDETYGRYPLSCVMRVFGKLIGGDFRSGKVYEMSSDFYSLDGDPLVAEFVTGPMPSAGQMADFNLLELDIDGGVGNDDSPTPQIGMEISDDDGKTFGNQRLLPMGPIGEYKTKVRWRRNGSSYFRRYRVKISDPVKRSLSSVGWIE